MVFVVITATISKLLTRVLPTLHMCNTQVFIFFIVEYRASFVSHFIIFCAKKEGILCQSPPFAFFTLPAPHKYSRWLAGTRQNSYPP